EYARFTIGRRNLDQLGIWNVCHAACDRSQNLSVGIRVIFIAPECQLICDTTYYRYASRSTVGTWINGHRDSVVQLNLGFARLSDMITQKFRAFDSRFQVIEGDLTASLILRDNHDKPTLTGV